jgi:hypothetical protein
MFMAFFLLIICSFIVPIYDYNTEYEDTEYSMYHVRMFVSVVNTVLLGSLLYSRAVLVVQSYSNHMLVQKMIEDF